MLLTSGSRTLVSFATNFLTFALFKDSLKKTCDRTNQPSKTTQAYIAKTPQKVLLKTILCKDKWPSEGPGAANTIPNAMPEDLGVSSPDDKREIPLPP